MGYLRVYGELSFDIGGSRGVAAELTSGTARDSVVNPLCLSG
jgi:hypothetical protein